MKEDFESMERISRDLEARKAACRMLEVEEDTSKEQLKKAYGQAAMKYHPDHKKRKQRKFLHLTEVMNTAKLSDNFYDEIKPHLHELIGRELRWAKHVLDLGCGACELVRYLADTYGQQVTGIDISSESFPSYQEITKASKNTKCIRKDAAHLEFLYGTVDAVIIMWALHEMDQPGKVLCQAYRVLRPGGKVLIVEFPRRSLAEKLWNEDYYTKKTLVALLREAGFKDIHAKLIEHKQILWVDGYRSTN